MRQREFDIVVIGSGIGGLSYALAVAEGDSSLSVAIVTKKQVWESNTNYAQGGIASVMSPLDSFEDHLNDTLISGAGLCDRKVVRRVVSAGPAAIARLSEIGVRFTESATDYSRESSRDSSADYDLAREGGHSAKRVVHADDLTGREVERALLAGCRSLNNVTMFQNHIAADVLIDKTSSERRVVGALVYDAATEEYVVFCGRLVLLATGGVGQVYEHTTNPLIATGDGIAIAYRAGCTVANLEFVQFHPTAFYEKAERSLLITEAVRGEGGRLRTISGHEFMSDYDERGDLAPRDIVARAIDREMKKSGDDYVLLDVSHIPEKVIRQRFPNIVQKLKERGIDFPRQAIPVVPSAHYLCGGVRSALTGETDLRGLLVCGESAHTGMHGANRLASNSLLEAVVMAEMSAEWTLQHIAEFMPQTAPEVPAYASRDRSSRELIALVHERRSLKSLMSDYLGIVRSLERLQLASERAQAVHDSVTREFANMSDVYAALELRNLALVAMLMIQMASRRHESRGLHYLLDFPEKDDNNWMCDSILQKEPDETSVEAGVN